MTMMRVVQQAGLVSMMMMMILATSSAATANSAKVHHNEGIVVGEHDAMSAWKKQISELPPLPMEPFRRLQEASSNSHPNWYRRHRAVQEVTSSLFSSMNGTSHPTITLDYGDQHPWEKQQQQQHRQLSFLGPFDPTSSHSSSSSSSSSSTTTTTTSSSVYEPIRIHFLTDPLQALIGQDTSINNKVNYIINTVLPKVAKVWSSHLSVVPNTSPIPIDSSVCFGMFDGQLPVNVIKNGVSDADLVIISTMADSLTTSDGSLIDFCSTGVLAVATYCSTDQYDRPTIGLINFCPPTSSSSSSSMAASSTNEGGNRQRQRQRRRHLSSPFPAQISAVSQQDNILVAIHEVGHVLGMSIQLFPYFRNPLTGQPLTERPIAETVVKCTNGNLGSQSMVFPSSKIIQSGTTSNGLLYYEIVTPRVQSVVRNHFNCQSLTGARLEIQDTSATSCVGSHWDERLMYSELMSPIFSGTADDLSPLTLALMEDSGWYQVNYGGAIQSPFGLGAGCDFVEKSCIINDAVPSWGKDYFCSTPTTVRSDGSVYMNDNDVVCDPNHYQMTVCALFDQSQVPSGFLTNAVDVTYFSDQNLVGTFEQASYCPMPIFSTNVDCTDTSTKQFTTYHGEEYGSNSRCINANFQDPSSGSQVVMPGCFNIQCDRENFRVVVNGVPCEYDFQQISIQTTSFTSATMECPRLSTVCPDLFCPNDCSGRGVCQYEAISGGGSSTSSSGSTSTIRSSSSSSSSSSTSSSSTGTSKSAKAPQCQCTNRNVTAADCQNGTLPPAVPIFYSQSSKATSLHHAHDVLGVGLGAWWILTLGLLIPPTWTFRL